MTRVSRRITVGIGAASSADWGSSPGLATEPPLLADAQGHLLAVEVLRQGDDVLARGAHQVLELLRGDGALLPEMLHEPLPEALHRARVEVELGRGPQG